MTDEKDPIPTPATPPVLTLPTHVAQNVLIFLERVTCTGKEAVAWLEAYQTMQRFVVPVPGVQFPGIPGAST